MTYNTQVLIAMSIPFVILFGGLIIIAVYAYFTEGN